MWIIISDCSLGSFGLTTSQLFHMACEQALHFDSRASGGSRSFLHFRCSLVTRNEELARRPCGTADLWWDQNYPENNRLLLFTFKLSIHFWFFLNLSTNYWMRLRPKTHENCIILQIIQKPNPICYNYSFYNSSYFKTSCKVAVFVQLFICLFFGKCRV